MGNLASLGMSWKTIAWCFQPVVFQVSLTGLGRNCKIAWCVHACFYTTSTTATTTTNDQQPKSTNKPIKQNKRNTSIPAGALKYNLANLCLGLDKRGHILVDGFVKLHMLQAPLEQLKEALIQAWLERLPDEISTRKDWRRPPIIDENATKKLLSTFPAKSQKILAFEITGAYQTAHQKVKWTQLDTTQCPHCHEEDSVLHRRLWCTALQKTRDEYGPLVQELKEMHPILVTLPVVFQHTLAPLDRCLAWQAPRMQPNEHVLDAIRRQTAQGCRPLIYTDGSASPPDIPSARKAAFAIVFLPHEAERETQAIVDEFRQHQQISQRFQTVGVARTRGPQTIPRSELQAAVEVIRHLDQAEVVTDSQYVIDSVEKINTGMTTHQLGQQPNCDLLLEMQTKLLQPEADFSWTKVRSHQSDLTGQSLREQLHAVGNEAADHAAKEARKTLADQTTFVPLHDFLEATEVQKQQYEMTLELNRHRTRLEDATKMEEIHEVDNDTEQILHVEILQCHEFEHTERSELLRWSTWGQGLAEALVVWLKGLKWPAEAFDDALSESLQSPGITWTEMLLDFQQTTQTLFPMNFAEKQKPQRLRTPSLHPDCHQGDMHMTGMTRSFQAAIRQQEKILDMKLLPTRRKVVRSLYQMGAGHQPVGIAVRPILWNPNKVQTMIQTYFAQHPRSWMIEGILMFEQAEAQISIQWSPAERFPATHAEEHRAKTLLAKLKDWNR